jgi:predicted ATP-dependent endonuclease of OLD family
MKYSWGNKMAWYQPGSTTLVGGSRTGPTTIVDAVDLIDNSTQNSTSLDMVNFPIKALTVVVTHTGTVADFRLEVTALSSREDVAASYAAIVTEVYEEDGVYHWDLEDTSRYFRVDVTSIGTADGSNYITVSVVLEGRA